MTNREMKDSGVEWIGEIPDRWVVGKVQTAFYRKKEKANVVNPTILSLARSGIKVRDISNNEGQLAADYSNYNPVSVGDVLLNPMDLVSGANCNISNIEGVISPAYINLRAKTNYSGKYYNYYFKLQYWSYAFFAHGKGVSYENRWTLNNETIMKYPIPVPSYEEQQKIAAFLDEKVSHIDKIIEDTKKSIENLKVYKQSLITETVTKGLSPDVETKDSGVEWFGRIPSHWKVSKVGNVFEVILGKMLSTFPKESNWTEERYLSAINVHFEGVETFNLKKMWFSPVEKEKLEVKFGDLLVVEGGAGAGGSALYLSEEKGIYVQNSINIVRPKANLSNTSFAYYIFYCLVKNGYVDYVSNKATIPHFTKEKVQSVPYPIIPLNEQQVIVEFLDERTKQVDSLIDQKEQLVIELESYKKSLIYEYVTGKKEVI